MSINSLSEALPGVYRDRDGDLWTRLDHFRGAVVRIQKGRRTVKVDWPEEDLSQSEDFGPFSWWCLALDGGSGSA